MRFDRISAVGKFIHRITILTNNHVERLDWFLRMDYYGNLMKKHDENQPKSTIRIKITVAHIFHLKI